MRTVVRTFERHDLEEIVRIYRKAFAEPPWNERWSREEVVRDLDYAESQRNPLILVAARGQSLVGFTWGYSVPFEEFPFLRGTVRQNTVYMDEIAVDPNARRMGVGRQLCNTFTQMSAVIFEEMVLRTDEGNVASINLFASLEFSMIGKIDERYPSRPYLKKELRR